ncbi:MAG: hypothetical protein R3B45_02875 [Bdellovibrionota bacterium]
MLIVKKKRNISVKAAAFLLYFTTITQTPITFAAKKDQTSNTKDNDSKLIVNIDNPEFRRLVMAIPNFKLTKEGKASLDAQMMAKEGAGKLSKLLEFSGLFNFMAESGYAALLTPSKKSSAISTNEELGGIDLQQWKGIGVESQQWERL